MKEVHFEPGIKSKIAIVFSCPGRLEQNAIPPGPAKGETGENLRKVLSILTQQYGLDGYTRPEITITNSWSKVEFDSTGGTGRSEATIEEIITPENLDRLSSEIGTINHYIFASGVNATIACNVLQYSGKLDLQVKIIELHHLGNRSINQINIDKNGNKIIVYKKASDRPSEELRSIKQIKKDNKQARLEKIAFDLYLKISE
ncbi:hypothetical protein N9901_02315 [Flavobacteriaceae bacterium]|nr:hypothetical protein [Flavobacteriaceae bacterium]